MCTNTKQLLVKRTLIGLVCIEREERREYFSNKTSKVVLMGKGLAKQSCCPKRGHCGPKTCHKSKAFLVGKHRKGAKGARQFWDKRRKIKVQIKIIAAIISILMCLSPTSVFFPSVYSICLLQSPESLVQGQSQEASGSSSACLFSACFPPHSSLLSAPVPFYVSPAGYLALPLSKWGRTHGSPSLCDLRETIVLEFWSMKSRHLQD